MGGGERRDERAVGSSFFATAVTAGGFGAVSPPAPTTTTTPGAGFALGCFSLASLVSVFDLLDDDVCGSSLMPISLFVSSL